MSCQYVCVLSGKEGWDCEILYTRIFLLMSAMSDLMKEDDLRDRVVLINPCGGILAHI